MASPLWSAKYFLYIIAFWNCEKLLFGSQTRRESASSLFSDRWKILCVVSEKNSTFVKGKQNIKAFVLSQSFLTTHTFIIYTIMALSWISRAISKDPFYKNIILYFLLFRNDIFGREIVRSFWGNERIHLNVNTGSFRSIGVNLMDRILETFAIFFTSRIIFIKRYF